MGPEHHVPLYPDATPLPILVHVTAPASLPAGYTFEAELNGDKTRTFTVEVVSTDKLHFCWFLLATHC